MPNQRAAPSSRTRVRRVPQRGVYDPATIRSIIDDAVMCQVGFAMNGHPAVVPVACARDGDSLLLHCARASRLARALGSGQEICVAITHLDGLVLARSAFHHSMNYRSVVIYGRPDPITEPGALRAALATLTEHLAPGRWPVIRQPSAQELRATVVFRVALAEASAKVRRGPPADEPEDLRLNVWAGVIPIRAVRGKPEPDGNANAPGRPRAGRAKR
jgi:nitroimidazol reductase NimA-like FMN-containing flavoprotein (pyridoxamine 5'-phosphate oxidase superfamily)